MMKNGLYVVELYPVHMQGDYVRANENIKAKRKLCKRCGGTGNELMSMYHKCPKCKGRGWVKKG